MPSWVATWTWRRWPRLSIPRCIASAAKPPCSRFPTRAAARNHTRDLQITQVGEPLRQQDLLVVEVRGHGRDQLAMFEQLHELTDCSDQGVASHDKTTI